MNEVDRLKVYLMTDNTYSMGAACRASRHSSAEVMAIGNLATGRNDCVTIGVIGDYDNSTPDPEQGGYALLRPGQTPQEQEAWFAKYMQPHGGGGAPEAYKTALNCLLREPPGILLLFLDDVPHGVLDNKLDSQGICEQKYLQAHNMIEDWEQLTTTFKKAGFQTVIFVTSKQKFDKRLQVYASLGHVVQVKDNNPTAITAAMLHTLFMLLGQDAPDSDMRLTYHYTDTETHQIEVSPHVPPYCRLDLRSQVLLANPDVVISVFEKLLDPSHPEQALCLTSNAILGKYWRLVCGSYRIVQKGIYEARCQNVMNQLSQVITQLDAGPRVQMQTWISTSHDDTALVREMIAKNILFSSHVFTLPIEFRAHLSREDVLELGRGGSFRGLAKAIAEIQISHRQEYKLSLEDVDECPNFIPCSNMDALEVMRLIGNLLSPKLVFSKTVAMFAAILCLSNTYLHNYAMEALCKNIGTWIDWGVEDDKQTQPVFWSHNVMMLLKLAPDEVLTHSEVSFRNHYHRISHFTKLYRYIALTVPQILDAPRKDVTWKRLCKESDGGCGIERCFTMFPGDSNVCGLCLAFDPNNTCYSTNVNISKQYGHSLEAKKYIEPSATETNWIQCHTCHANYGIVNVANLKVRPKCHFCRIQQPPQTATCTWCRNKYLSPGGSAGMARVELTSPSPFVCPRCESHGSPVTSDVTVRIKDFLEENKQLKALAPVQDYDYVMDESVKLWRRVRSEPERRPDMEEVKCTDLTFRGFAVHDSEACISLIRDMLYASGNEFTSSCCVMCLEEVPVKSMTPCCGACSNTMCTRCILAWYGQTTVIGKLISQNHTQCPFCKAPAKYAVIKNLEVRKVRNIRPTHKNNGQNLCKWDPHFLYATCIQCLYAKQALPRACVDNDIPEINNFVCDECVAQRNMTQGAITLQHAQDALTKNCPSCQAPTMKAGGCNHITCAKCLQHWCWSCGMHQDASGKVFTQHSIYGHMSRCGGIWPAVEGEYMPANITDDEEED